MKSSGMAPMFVHSLVSFRSSVINGFFPCLEHDYML